MPFPGAGVRIWVERLGKGPSMTLPGKREIEIPLLQEIERAGGAAKPRDLYGKLAAHFPEVTEADLEARLPKAGHLRWANRVQWVRQFLVTRGEIDGSVRGVWVITQAGRGRLTARRKGSSAVPPSTTTRHTAQAGQQGQQALRESAMDTREAEGIRDVVRSITARIRRFKDRKLGEENTKATMIEPVLEVLGWDIRDPDEVHREFKSKTRDRPVDYALKLLRKPRLFIEAKGLGMNLSDRKWVSQILGYATVAGVEWCVLTDGDEYRFYNATAPVDAEEKLFCRIRLSEDDGQEVVRTLNLISRGNLEENLLDVLWEAHFVDRRVKDTILNLLATADKSLIRLIRKRHQRLLPKEIADSIRRLEVTIDSPVRTVTPPARPATRRRQRPAPKRRAGKRTRIDFGVKVTELIEAGVLKPPVPLFRKYKGEVLKAVLLPNGAVEFRGKRCDSLSSAGEQARAAVTGRKMNTNGWSFWQYRAEGGTVRTVADARGDFLARRR